MHEVMWKEIPWLSDYQISEAGVIRRKESCKAYKGRVLKPQINQQGYLSVGVTVRGKYRRFNVHRLVCEAFHGPKPDGYHAAHSDGCRLNNHSSNLRWATPKENSADQARHGTQARGSKQGLAKLTEASVRDIARRRQCETLATLASEYGVHVSTIVRALSGKTWAHV